MNTFRKQEMGSIRSLIEKIPRQIFSSGAVLLLAIIIPCGVIFGIQFQKREYKRIVESNANYFAYLVSINDVSGINQHLRMLAGHHDVVSIMLEGPGFAFTSNSSNGNERWFFKNLLISDSLSFQLRNVSNRALLTWKMTPNLQFLTVISVLSCALIVLITAVAAFFTRRLSSLLIGPFDEVEGLIERVDLDSPDQVKVLSRWKEVQRLGEKFEIMLARLKGQEAMRRELMETKARVAIGRQVAHDIRSPLSFLNILAKRAEGLKTNERELLGSVVQRLDRMIDDLTDAKFQGASSELINLSELIPDLLKEKEVEFSSRFPNVKLILTVEEGIMVNGERSKIGRAFSNLLNNCAEAYGNNSGAVYIELKSCGGDGWRLSIKDSAGGIPEAVLTRILGGESVTSKEGHSGLGLSYARTVFENLGAKTKINAIAGTGTEIEFLSKI